MISYEVYESKTNKLIFAGDLDLAKLAYMPARLVEALSENKLSKGDFISFDDEFLYGNYRDDKIYKIPKINFAELSVNKGDSIGAFLEKGVATNCKIVDMDEENIYIDLNHPLVDKNLYVKIINVKE